MSAEGQKELEQVHLGLAHRQHYWWSTEGQILTLALTLRLAGVGAGLYLRRVHRYSGVRGRMREQL